MKQFNLEQYLQDTSKKVVTRKGMPVRIRCTDLKKPKNSNSNFRIIALIDKGEEVGEEICCYKPNGKYYEDESYCVLDLFFADEEDGLTEYEQEVKCIIRDIKNGDAVEDYKFWSQRLLDLAKKQLQPEIDEQKPANKVKPKYKAGDWIIKNDDSSINTDYSCCEITKVENGNYTIESIYGCKGYNTFETFEKDYHLWTIQDAKDGDVLALEWKDECQWQKIVIFKSLNEFGVEGYGYTFKNNKLAFKVDVPCYSKTWTKHLHPATKEQRDLLFSKMKEAGYKWDAEKKELQKIEQKSTWNEEDENMRKKLLFLMEEENSISSWEGCYEWLKSLKNRF